MSIGIDKRSRNAKPGISQGCKPMASKRRERTNLSGTPIQKAGHATSRPNLTDEM
jgi:hypothetical protein